MRAMILAAGMGTRLRPLTELRAKPALPIRGRPVISLLLDFLSRHSIHEVMINLHYLPESIREAVENDRPDNLSISWSEEPRPLGTGGGIRRAAAFLGAGEECVVLAGDMLLDLNLADLLARHRASGRDVTLLLRDDGRGEDFGTIGLDARGDVTRIGKRSIGGEEVVSGLFTGLRIFSKHALCDWPEDEIFEDLRDWLVPGMLERGVRVGAEILAAEDCVWEPVGTPAEYLSANLSPPALPSLGGGAEQWAGDVRVAGDARDVLLGAHAEVPPDARLERVVVWEDECVPSGFAAQDGVIASGRFHDCRPDPAATRLNP